MILTLILLAVLIWFLKVFGKVYKMANLSKMASLLSIVYFSVKLYELKENGTISIDTGSFVMLRGGIEWLFNTGVALLKSGLAALISLIPVVVKKLMEVIVG